MRHPGIHVEQETHGLGLLRGLQQLTEVRVGGPVARTGKDLHECGWRTVVPDFLDELFPAEEEPERTWPVRSGNGRRGELARPVGVPALNQSGNP